MPGRSHVCSKPTSLATHWHGSGRSERRFIILCCYVRVAHRPQLGAERSTNNRIECSADACLFDHGKGRGSSLQYNILCECLFTVTSVPAPPAPFHARSFARASTGKVVVRSWQARHRFQWFRRSGRPRAAHGRARCFLFLVQERDVSYAAISQTIFSLNLLSPYKYLLLIKTLFAA